NRRKLLRDLETATAGLRPGERLHLTLFDLDGFKQYNDSFGHPAGDTLLVRLGERLDATIASHGVAYRMGGDEFCTVCRLDADDDPVVVVDAARRALAEHGDGFCVTCSYGEAIVTDGGPSADDALRLADQRLYAHKSFSPMRPTMLARDMLLQALVERSP